MSSLEIRPLSGALGAEIFGADVSIGVAPDVVEAIGRKASRDVERAFEAQAAQRGVDACARGFEVAQPREFDVERRLGRRLPPRPH